MMLITAAWRALVDAGVAVVPVDARHVELHWSGRLTRVALHTSARALHPSDVAEIVDRHGEPGMLVVPAATAAVLRSVERAGWSWLIAGPKGVRGVLFLGGEIVPIGGDHPGVGSQARRRSGPAPWGSLTVVRRLLQRPAATQKVLAALAGVSQPRVSQTLSALAERQIVMRGEDGWVVRDFDMLLRWWLDVYPGPGGISTFWYGLDTPRDQAKAVVDLLRTVAQGGPKHVRPHERLEEAPIAVVSGDVAADLLAPWRNPTRAVIYATVGADLTRAGLSPAGMEEATLELIVPEDRGVWPVHPQLVDSAVHRELPIADPLQVLWDVSRAPGPDSDEAAAQLWHQLADAHRHVVHSAVQ
jgi:hypothetical protein